MRKLILGPPGCGKTTRLLSIMEQEMKNAVHPKRICFISFTRKAAYEAAERAAAKFNLAPDDLHFFRTLHSLAYRQLGVARDALLSQSDWDELGRMLGVKFSRFYMTEEGLFMGNEKGDHLRFIDGFARSRMITVEEAWRLCAYEDVSVHECIQFSQTFKQYKTDAMVMDYTDMIEQYIVAGSVLDIDVAFIDEAQDLSTLQWAMANKVTSNAKRVYIGGDDDQAIYKWSGADVDLFLGLQGEVENLQLSHRLPRTVYSLANSISAQIHNRFDKPWNPRDEEGSVSWVSTPAHIDLKQGTWLLLARNVYMLKELAAIARQQGVAYAVKGVSAVKKSDVNAIVAWERLRKGEDVTLEEVKSCYHHLRVGSGVKRGFKTLPGATNTLLYNLIELKTNYGLLRDDVWYDALEGISAEDRTYYQTILRNGDSLKGAPRVNISTIHGVKGGEADNVLLLTDMAFRTYREYEQHPDDEHRVFYVGVTRARHSLYLCEPQTRFYYPM